MAFHLVRMSVAATLAVAALSGAAALAQAPRQTPPPGGDPRPFVLPETTRFLLPNGLQITLVPYGTVPKVSVSLIVGVGNAHEQADQVWLADMTGELLREGTTTRTSAQVAEAAGGMGGALTVGVSGDQTTIGLDVLSESAPDAVALVAEVAMRPAFPASELPRVRDNLIRQLTVARSTPGALASERFAATLYPNHPYGRLFPTEAQLAGYDLDAARAFHQAHFVPNRSHLYVVGQFDAAAVRVAVERAFAGWAKGAEASRPPVTPVAVRSVHLVDRPGAPQSTLRLGLPVVDPSHKDYVALQVTNALLGGSFASRITSNIREQKGYTYSPTSQLASHPGVAHWVEMADVTTAVTGPALTEIFGEIERLRREPPSEEELAGFRNYLAGVFVLQNSSRAGITNQLAFTQLHKLGDDHLKTFVSRVQAVTPADVQRIAREYLVPGKMTLVVVGDAATIRAQVAPFDTKQ
jgi:predicted Zn-dependent peptidase